MKTFLGSSATTRRGSTKPPESLGEVTVRFGTNEVTVQVTPGMTVGKLRSQVGEVLNIPAEAVPVGRGGAGIGENLAVTPQTGAVEFVRTAGENG